MRKVLGDWQRQFTCPQCSGVGAGDPRALPLCTDCKVEMRPSHNGVIEPNWQEIHEGEKKRLALDGNVRYTTAKRKRTHIFIHNYEYWECGACRWHPGGSNGPPTETCQNCGSSQYTDDPDKAASKIKIVATGYGLNFEILAHYF